MLDISSLHINESIVFVRACVCVVCVFVKERMKFLLILSLKKAMFRELNLLSENFI